MNEREKQAARKLLEEHKCDETTYEGSTLEEILRDLNYAYPQGNCGGLPNRAMARAIRQISTIDRGWASMKKIEIVGNASHSGFSDLYPNVKCVFEAAITAKYPFDSGWLSSEKEIGAWHMTRKYINGPIAVEFGCELDNMDEYAWNCTPDGYELDDAQTKKAIDFYMNGDAPCVYKEERKLPSETGLKGILSAVSEMADGCLVWQRDCDRNMEACVRCVLGLPIGKEE